LFSRFFWFLTKSIKNLEKTKKQKTTKFQTLTHQLVPTWVLQFCFFLVSRGFLILLVKNQKPRENQKNKIADPNSPACAYMGLAIFVFLLFFGFLEVF